jgi:hypothetical protein
VAVLVAQIQSGCHRWMLFATIHGGPILLPYWALESPSDLCRPKGYCVLGGRPSHPIFLENAVGAKFARPIPVSWGAAKVTQRRPGRTREPKRAGAPSSFRRPASVAHCLRGSGLRPCKFRAMAARAGRSGVRKRPAAQEGGETGRRTR